MEVPGGDANKKHVFVYEMLGTAFLLFAINSSATFGSYQPFAVGLSIFANICVFGAVSGGHFNPAVTLGVFVKEGRSKMGHNAYFFVEILIA
jgi:aquaporin Z